MSGKIIEVRNLSRSYGRNKAVDNVSFSVEEGSVHGFLGPNGAGKTTVIKMLLGLIMPDCGEVEIFGLDFFSRRNEILKRVGAVVETPAFFEYLTAFENLKFLSKFSGGCAEERILEALSIVGLSDVKDKCVGTFSYGMKQRLGIAQTLLPDNRLVFLDEPTNGLDPHGIGGVRRLIKRLSVEKGVTVFLSSHLLGEVEQVCDKVSIIAHGKIICESDVPALLQAEERIEILCEASSAEALPGGISEKIISSERHGKKLRVLVNGAEEKIPEHAKALCDAGIRLYGISRIKRKLEDVFVELTGKDAGDVRTDRF